MSHRAGMAVALATLISACLIASCIQLRTYSSAQRAVLQGTFQVRAKEAAPLGTVQTAIRIRGGPDGTAFQISANELVTAAHVLENFIGGRYSTPVLVDADNRNTYEIGDVLGFDDINDIAIFRLKPSPRAVALEVNTTPPAEGATVHVAGFLHVDPRSVADYDGAICFDASERAGRTCKHEHQLLPADPDSGVLRFTDPPPRGNSGGPLLDQDWHVMGMIQWAEVGESGAARAMPIPEILNFYQRVRGGAQAIVTSSSPYGLVAALECDASLVINSEISLPQSFEKLSAQITGFRGGHVKATLDTALEQRLASVATEQPLAGADRCDIADTAPNQSQVDRWPSSAGELSSPEEVKSADAVIVISRSSNPTTLAAKDHLRLAQYGQHEPWMEKLLALRNSGGNIETLDIETTFKDGWARTWQVRQWQLPEDDLVLISLARATSYGYVAIVRVAPTAAAPACTRTLELVTMRKDLSCPRRGR